jgi:hypothetical protein
MPSVPGNAVLYDNGSNCTGTPWTTMPVVGGGPTFSLVVATDVKSAIVACTQIHETMVDYWEDLQGRAVDIHTGAYDDAPANLWLCTGP